LKTIAERFLKKTIIAHCDGGFGNRYHTLVSCIALSRQFDTHLVVSWPKNEWCEANYSDLFATQLPVIEQEIPELTSGRVNQLEPCLKGGYALFNYQALSNLELFAETLDLAPIGAACAFTHLPLGIESQRMIEAFRSLEIHQALIGAAQDFIRSQLGRPYYGIHLRRTDIHVGFTDHEIGKLLRRYEGEIFFLCSDDPESEKKLASPNLRTRVEKQYVQKKLTQENWTHPTQYGAGSQYTYNSNLVRTADSMKDAVVDAIILANSSLVGDSPSTFFHVAQEWQKVGLFNYSEGLPALAERPILHLLAEISHAYIDVPQLFTKLDFLNRNEEHAALALCYDTWVKRNPDRLHPAVLYNQAVANLAQGKNDEASQLLREALVLEPGFEPALHAMALVA